MSMYYSLVKKTIQPHVHSKKNRTSTNGIEVVSSSTSTDSNCTRVLVILRLSGVARYDVVVHEKSSILILYSLRLRLALTIPCTYILGAFH